jgi:O-antigen/teichoic acid export membrane protein
MKKYISYFKNLMLSYKSNIFAKLFKNTGILLAGNIAASLFSIISIAILVRAIGIEQYGWLVLIQTYSLTIDKLMNFQSWQALIKYGAEAIENRDNTQFASYIKQGIMIDIFTAILAASVAFISIDFIGNFMEWQEHIISIGKIYTLSILFHISGTPIGILRIFNNFKLISLNKTGVAILKLAGIAIAYHFNADFIAFVYISLALNILGDVSLIAMSYYTVTKNGYRKWRKIKVKNWNNFLQFAIFSNLTSTLDIPVKHLDVFIISAVLSIEAVGAYKIIKQLAIVFSKLADPVYQAVYPQLAIFCARKEYEKARDTVIKIGLFIIAFSAPVVLIASVTAKWWLNLFFGGDMVVYSGTLTLYLVLKVISISFIALHPLFIALGHIKYNVLIMGISNGIYMICAWFFGINYGLVGIISAYGIQFSVVILMKMNILAKKENI